MTEFKLQISEGLVLTAKHEFVMDETTAYICTRLAASPEPGDCPGWIEPGSPHVLVTIEEVPLLRWCSTCAPGIVGRSFNDWQAQR